MIEVRLLTAQDKRADFSCGNIELDYYFQKFAGQNQFKNFIGSNYIVVDNEEILAFASVSTGEIYKESLAPESTKRLPNYPLPVIRLTRLGVKTAYQNSGIGKYLIRHVFSLSLEQKIKLGCFGVLVDAKDDAVSYYNKLGFSRLQIINNTSTTPMFLSIRTIEKSLK